MEYSEDFMSSLYGSQLFNNPSFYPNINTLLKRVSSVKEVESQPITTLNSEEVYLNAEDDTVMYIRRIDPSGKCIVKRYRFYEDPEPTQQQINDDRYVTKEDFNKLHDEIYALLNQNNRFNGRNKNNGPKPINENV